MTRVRQFAAVGDLRCAAVEQRYAERLYEKAGVRAYLGEEPAPQPPREPPIFPLHTVP